MEVWRRNSCHLRAVGEGEGCCCGICFSLHRCLAEHPQAGLMASGGVVWPPIFDKTGEKTEDFRSSRFPATLIDAARGRTPCAQFPRRGWDVRGIRNKGQVLFLGKFVVYGFIQMRTSFMKGAVWLVSNWCSFSQRGISVNFGKKRRFPKLSTVVKLVWGVFCSRSSDLFSREDVCVGTVLEPVFFFITVVADFCDLVRNMFLAVMSCASQSDRWFWPH